MQSSGRRRDRRLPPASASRPDSRCRGPRPHRPGPHRNRRRRSMTTDTPTTPGLTTAAPGDREMRTALSDDREGRTKAEDRPGKVSVGLLGVGLMGSAMARRLLDRDIAVVAWDRDAEAV